MLSFVNRHKWWLILAVLVVLNIFRYWPVKHASQTAGGFPGMGPGGFPQMTAAMQARIDALPDDQRQAVEDRIAQDKQFFATLQGLPHAEQQQKMMQHFMENPPPPGMFPSPPPGGFAGGPGGPPGAGPGGGPGQNGFGNGGVPPIPPPDVRRGFEQGMVNSLKNAGIQP